MWVGAGVANLLAIAFLRSLVFLNLSSCLQTRSTIVIASLALKTCFIAHVLACIWVFVGRQGSMAQIDNWLSNEMKVSHKMGRNAPP